MAFLMFPEQTAADTVQQTSILAFWHTFTCHSHIHTKKKKQTKREGIKCSSMATSEDPQTSLFKIARSCLNANNYTSAFPAMRSLWKTSAGFLLQAPLGLHNSALWCNKTMWITHNLQFKKKSHTCICLISQAGKLSLFYCLLFINPSYSISNHPGKHFKRITK